MWRSCLSGNGHPREEPDRRNSQSQIWGQPFFSSLQFSLFFWGSFSIGFLLHFTFLDKVGFCWVSLCMWFDLWFFQFGSKVVVVLWVVFFVGYVGFWLSCGFRSQVELSLCGQLLFFWLHLVSWEMINSLKFEIVVVHSYLGSISFNISPFFIL